MEKRADPTAGREIRLRIALAVVEDGRILLVPHYQTNAGPVQWLIPGGSLTFGEQLEQAALREFREETGLLAQVLDLLDVRQVILPERPYHSITITYKGKITGGTLAAETNHPYGEKIPRWFSRRDLVGLAVHPAETVEKALLSG